MKKTVLVLSLVVLALFSQCKKQESYNKNEQTNGVQMVLTVTNEESRTFISNAGGISWSSNDKVYVIANGFCVGYVTNGSDGGNVFTGILNISSGTYDFHYYYVGTNQTISIGDESFSMDFSNQDGLLANLGNFHVGYGTQSGVEVTQGETVTSESTMQTLIAMAYFDIAGMAEIGETVYLYGENINNQLTIDFSNNVPTYGKADNEKANLICAGTVSGEETSPIYLILLPNHTDGTEELATDITFVSKRTTGTCNGVFNYGIVSDRFYCEGGHTDSPIAVNAASYDEGALRGLFSISSGIQTHFSQGNLLYEENQDTWRFTEQQLNSVENGWQQNFCWGSGDDPTNFSLDYHDHLNFVDWGVNAIANGGNEVNIWRTPSSAEWDYVFTGRANATAKYGTCTIDEKKGMILLPDDFEMPIGITFNSGMSTAPDDWTHNVFTQDQWFLLEAVGAVFFPHNDAYYEDSYPYFGGCYWSSDEVDDEYAYTPWFDGCWLNAVDVSGKMWRFGVRLIRTEE